MTGLIEKIFVGINVLNTIGKMDGRKQSLIYAMCVIQICRYRYTTNEKKEKERRERMNNIWMTDTGELLNELMKWELMPEIIWILLILVLVGFTDVYNLIKERKNGRNRDIE